MVKRILKYYEWVYEDGAVSLLDKRNSNKMVLSMAMAESFCRACIGFRNRQRIEQVAGLQSKFRLVKRKVEDEHKKDRASERSE
jgi:hypothetical protein